MSTGLPHPMRRVSVVVALALATTATGLHAQSGGGNPLDQLPATRPLQPVPPPRTTVDVQAPAGPAEAKLARSVTPSRFDIEGVNAIPFADVANLFAPLAGQPVTVARLVALSRDATALYRERGHPLSFVFVPDQSFDGGVVRVVAVEGYIASVRIEGDSGAAEPKLREIAERLQADRPLSQATFERVTQLLARLPGVKVDATASLPETTDGATVLVLKVKRQPYNVSLGADVRQPTPRAVLSGVLNDPFGSGGQLSASTLLGNFEREKLLTLGYTQLVGADGLQLKTSFSTYRGYPDEQLGRGEPLERFNTNRRFELSASYPLYLSARSSVTLNGGFYAVDNVDDYRERSTGGRLADDTRVRALFAQLAYADAQPDRSRSASVLVAQGIDGVGAQAEVRSNIAGLSGPGSASLDFTRIAFDASQRDRFANQWGTGVSFGAQYSGHTLAASERISFGGARFGRGYAAGDAAGDAGWGVGLELNRLFKFDGVWLNQVEPYLLVEAARVSNHVGTPAPEKLRSVALGVRLSDSRYYSVDIAVAKPTGDASATNPARKPRLSLMLSYQLAAN
ncbi:ShlB/FhaC/HecB family hemolysin secretion/activation protein [Variovorax sp. PAMC 28711]|uniref:ShlB/FhaC/HecB family hemolysin secretion/activation protein n=1 Tax=Variovorax sp. PAMC 28711 TaxID=1795631 RepID=UPI0009E92DB5|nr:POTRA domain-containing protein [Variovorax sp. PAMC 28711]